MNERRYDDDEVAAIFEAAASPQASRGRALAAADGLSLAELQVIGGEAGIAPERIADAAAALDQRGGAAPRRTYLGMPVSVGRTVDLPRAPTDREWELLLAELRETFGAHGKDRSSGGLRAWTNGNLHAYVEPTEAGYRLRLGTTKGNAVALGRVGVAALLPSLVMTVYLLATGELGDGSIFSVVAALSAAGLGANALRLPGWAQEREEQMEHIAARARTLIAAAPAADGSGDAG
jgi:hypothetical protein